MLFKGGNDLPTEVREFSTAYPLKVEDSAGETKTATVTPAELALAAAEEENQHLRNQLQQVRTEHSIEIALAREAARREAAAEHIRNDEELRAILSSALIAAQDIFRAELRGSCQTLAAQLASAALERLVQVSSKDETWLLRVIERRLADLDAASVVSIVLADGNRTLADKLASSVGTSVVFEQGLPNNSARIDLTMGSIPIQIDVGLANVLSALQPADDWHD
jgi:hypothetical protein